MASDKFVTFFHGVQDARLPSFAYTNAGHLAPILIRAAGSIQRLAVGGAALGVFPDWKYEAGSVQFFSGDRMLLSTGSVTEATRADGEEFGKDRLIAAASGSDAATPAQLNVHLLAEARCFCNSQMYDATLMVAAAQHARHRLVARVLCAR